MWSPGTSNSIVGRSVAQWNLDLDPPAGHLDRRITVTTPLQKAGAYLLTATMDGGNTARIIVWLDDTVIVKKPLADQDVLLRRRCANRVASSAGQCRTVRLADGTGRRQERVPRRDKIARARHRRPGPGRRRIGRLQRAAAVLPVARHRQNARKVAQLTLVSRMSGPFPTTGQCTTRSRLTRSPTGRCIARARPCGSSSGSRRARFDQHEKSEFAGQHFAVQIRNPKGEEVFSKLLFADEFGGYDGSFDLPSDAMLGVYQIFTPDRGGGSFRVEEYKKPEFEVKVDAPTTPVMLGEKITATIKASYYFGGPVAEGRSSTRSPARRPTSDGIRPRAGIGFSGLATGGLPPIPRGTPAGRDGGCFGHWDRGGRRHYEPPEVVAEATVPIRPDGTLAVEIDTALAKAAHPDQDQRV